MRRPFGRASEVTASGGQAVQAPVEIDNIWDDERGLWSSRERAPRVRVCHYCRTPIEGDVKVLHSGKFHCGCSPEAEAESQRQMAESRTQHAAQWPLFDLRRPCPKCGNGHRTAALHEPFGPWAHCSLDLLYCPGGTWPHIKRECGVCGFVSYELPLDFEP